MLDQELEQNTDTEDTTDDALYCAECGHLITRTRWAISMDGHERVFINPAGRVFRVCCFSEAPGASDVGAFTSEHTWFPGFGGISPFARLAAPTSVGGNFWPRIGPNLSWV